MNFENFKTQIESTLKSTIDFELQEFIYQPFNFGNGILAYRINGQIHKFIFDGRENELTWLKSKIHQKYFDADLTIYQRIEGLSLEKKDLLEGIKKTT